MLTGLVLTGLVLSGLALTTLALTALALTALALTALALSGLALTGLVLTGLLLSGLVPAPLAEGCWPPAGTSPAALAAPGRRGASVAVIARVARSEDKANDRSIAQAPRSWSGQTGRATGVLSDAVARTAHGHAELVRAPPSTRYAGVPVPGTRTI